MIARSMALLLLIVPVAYADTSIVYESYDDVEIGRVFLSRGEREFLDARRHYSPSDIAAESAQDEDKPAAAAKPPAAGFIIGPSGRSRVWKEGDFVEAAERATRSLTFPGDIKIVRHAAKDEPGDDD